MEADVPYTEGRRGVQRLADPEIPIIAAVNGPVSVHSEYALLADVVIASDTTEFSDLPHLAFGIAPGRRPVRPCGKKSSASTGPATWRSPRDRSPHSRR
jgi:enoyl-CoA hydratase/carnithine racemase